MSRRLFGNVSRSDAIALLLSLLAVLAAYLVAERVFERMAHLEDEMAYTWQARLIADDKLTIPSPPYPKSMLTPFVVDYVNEAGNQQNSQRFGKYPPGWPAALSLGVRLGVRWLVNPLLAGLGVWLTYRLSKRVFGTTVALLASLLTLVSPFFLMNSGSLLSHPLGLVLSAAFALGWLEAFWGDKGDPWLPALASGACLGLLALTRPLTAVAVGLPFGIHGLYLLTRGDRGTRLRLLALGGLALVIGSLLFAWQYALTGDALLNPYTLWWPYDKVGFGPGHGVSDGGHTLKLAMINTLASLRVGAQDLFGWSWFSWIFLPFGLLALRRKRSHCLEAWLLSSVVLSLALVYQAYWVTSPIFGPRYYYEGLYSLTLLSAAGIAWLAGWPIEPGSLLPPPSEERAGSSGRLRRTHPIAIAIFLAVLIAVNLFTYLPSRLGGLHGLYGVQRSNLEPFLTDSAQELTPALVIVHIQNTWTDYGTLLELQDPYLSTPFIFALSRDPDTNAAVAASYPSRQVYHYYPDEPYTFYRQPRP